MKAFRAWLEKSRPTYHPFTEDDWFYEQGWKAALEWVRDELCPGNGKAEIREDIEEELEDG